MRAPLVALVFTLVGCGGAPPVALNPGIIEGQPTIVALPQVDVPLTSMSEHMQSGWALAEDAFEMERPTPPAQADAADLQAWSEAVLRPWLSRKQHAVELARAELDLAADTSHRELIVSGALVGMLYEDIGWVVRQMPVPTELQTEPEIAAIYRDVLDSEASPFVEHARRAYRACTINAAQLLPSLEHFSRFCDARSENLPPSRVTTGGEDEVDVTVVAP